MSPDSERPLPTAPFVWGLASMLAAFVAVAVAYVWFFRGPAPEGSGKRPPDPETEYYRLITSQAEALPDAELPPADADAMIAKARRHLGDAADMRARRFEKARTVEDLADRWLESWEEIDPDAAVELGLARSPRLTRYTLDFEYRSLLDDALTLKRLNEIEPGRVSMDARLLGAILEGGILYHEWRGDRLRDPRPALWGIQACYTLLAPTEEADDASWAIVAERLAHAPEVVEEVRERLEDPPALWIELALEDLEGTLTFLDECAEATRRRPGDVASRVGGGARRARDALEAYRKFLTDLLPGAGPVPRGRPVEVAWRIRAFEFDRRSPQGLVQILLEECDASVDRYDALMASAPRDTPRKEMSFKEYLGAFPALIEWAKAFTAREGIVSVPGGHPVTLTITPGHLRSWDAAALYSTQILADTPRPLMMVSPWKNHERVNQTFSENYLKLVALHESYPGHHLHDVLTRLAGASRLRRLYPSNWLLEGWATYCERLALEGELSGDPIPRADWHHQRNQLAWQSLLELCLTAGSITEDDAIGFLIRCVGYDEHGARIRVANATHYPLSTAGYLLGERTILDLRDELKKKLGGRFSLKEFHERLLAYGRAPLALVREDLLRTWR